LAAVAALINLSMVPSIDSFGATQHLVSSQSSVISFTVTRSRLE
jgi:hypothetical protein